MSKDSNLSKTSPPQPVLDSFKLSIAKRLSETLPLTIEQAFDGVDYGKKGEDFTVALPRFRLPGSISENASKVIEGVSEFYNCLQFLSQDPILSYSSRLTNG